MHGVYLPVVLQNGTGGALLQLLEGTPLEDRFLILDQGYAAASASVTPVMDAAKKLFLFALIGWLLLLLYLLLFQVREKRNLGVMRPVGAQPRQLRRSLFLSGLILAGIGFIIGVCLSSAPTGVVQEKLLSIAPADVQTSAHSGGMAINGASLAAMLDQGRLTPGDMALPGAAQIALAGVCLWLHAAWLSGREPRRLLGV